jgi:hypoxanthine phosphoribosyltransferase
MLIILMINMTNLFMSWEEFDIAIKLLAFKIKESGVEISDIYGIPRGGLVIAVKLSHLLNKPVITQLGLRYNTLIVDDIVDTGNTMIRHSLTASLFYNPKSIYKPKFYVYEKTDDRWIDFPWEKNL